MVIGITGGVGSGKSLVANYIVNYHNAHLLIADDIAKEFTQKDTKAYMKIIDFFGESVLDEFGQIKRAVLADIVFKDENKLKVLNSIIHPLVKEKIKEAIEIIYSKDTKALILIEAALLIEDNYKEICDTIWYIYSDISKRFDRVKKTRNYTREKFDIISKNQLSEDEFRFACDLVIDNNNDFENTISQIEKALVF